LAINATVCKTTAPPACNDGTTPMGWSSRGSWRLAREAGRTTGWEKKAPFMEAMLAEAQQEQADYYHCQTKG